MPIRIVDLTTDDTSVPDYSRPDQEASEHRGLGIWLLALATSLLVGVVAGWGLTCLLFGGCL
jgi:hypothetical protein